MCDSLAECLILAAAIVAAAALLIFLEAIGVGSMMW